jgi:hypothetical protein
MTFACFLHDDNENESRDGGSGSPDGPHRADFPADIRESAGRSVFMIFYNRAKKRSVFSGYRRDAKRRYPDFGPSCLIRSGKDQGFVRRQGRDL